MLMSIPFIMPWWFNCYSDEVFVPPPGCDFCWRWQRATPSYGQLFRQWWDTLSPYCENQGSVAGDQVLCCCLLAEILLLMWNCFWGWQHVQELQNVSTKVMYSRIHRWEDPFVARGTDFVPTWEPLYWLCVMIQSSSVFFTQFFCCIINMAGYVFRHW